LARSGRPRRASGLAGRACPPRGRESDTRPSRIRSAGNREAEKIAALDLGANDYVEKPFGVGELLARLRVNLRQSVARPEPTEPLVIGDVIIDLDRRMVSRGGQAVRLTPKEYDVLARLARDAGKVIGHRDLLVAVWGAAHW